MPKANVFRAIVILACTLLGGTASLAQIPPGYPRSYQEILDQARKEGRLRIYSNLGSGEAQPLLDAFRLRYPDIQLDYQFLWSSDLYRRFLQESEAKQDSADLLWSSAMDLQIKLVNDGYAQAYASPEKPDLPEWAVWKNEAYGVTADPIVIVYNKALVPAADVPRSHAEFVHLLQTKPNRYKGKISTYDPQQSGVGFLYITQDIEASSGTWDIINAIGENNGQLFPAGNDALKSVVSGESLFSYNMIGTYAFAMERKSPTLGVILPSDYTLLMSRVALIPASAKHSAAAKLFLDFALSPLGQSKLAEKNVWPVRKDVAFPADHHLAPEQVRAIRLGPNLLANLDQIMRAKILKALHRAAVGDEPR